MLNFIVGALLITLFGAIPARIISPENMILCVAFFGMVFFMLLLENTMKNLGKIINEIS